LTTHRLRRREEAFSWTTPSMSRDALPSFVCHDNGPRGGRRRFGTGSLQRRAAPLHATVPSLVERAGRVLPAPAFATSCGRRPVTIRPRCLSPRWSTGLEYNEYPHFAQDARPKCDRPSVPLTPRAPAPIAGRLMIGVRSCWVRPIVPAGVFTSAGREHRAHFSLRDPDPELTSMNESSSAARPPETDDVVTYAVLGRSFKARKPRHREGRWRPVGGADTAQHALLGDAVAS
jgi:hypothetical protein